MPWRKLRNPVCPWVVTVDRILQSSDPVTIEGPTLVIASDYAGIDKRSRYRVNVYLCVDLVGSMEWDILRRQVRRRYLADGRRMSYKQLSDRQRANAVLPFLSVAEQIHGICVVTIVNKALRYLGLPPNGYEEMRRVASLEAPWKNRELEEAVRAAHFIACLVAGLSQPGHNIYWISDEDNMFGNPKQTHDVARLLSSFTSHYILHILGDLGIGTTTLDQGDRLEEDLTAIADLVAGGIAETTNRLSESRGGRIPANLAVRYADEFLPKADLSARWFWVGAGRLRRVAILFEQQMDGQYSVSKYEMASE
jgi:hypothetical protein